ncbi:hypothetical protein F66182_239 [Fusarium sp. NRRL 66182]|nr:hypothetical protein F66182_239 [Fusarium sp. NRRL 66182]
MTLPSTSRRERLSREAAPRVLKEIDDSDGGSSPLSSVAVSPSTPISRTPAGDNKDGNGQSSSGSVASIPAITPQRLTTTNQNNSLSKRRTNEDDGGSPSKRPRRLIFKVRKRSGDDETRPAQGATPTQEALVHLPPQTIAPAQAPSSDLTNLQKMKDGLAAMQQVQGQLTATIQQSQIGVDLEQANKRIAILEQKLQAAPVPRDTQDRLIRCQEKLERTIRSEINLRAENDKLRRERDQFKAFNDELRTDMAKVIDEKEEHMNDAFKVTDDQVKLEWRGIAFEIRNFVSQVLTVVPHGVRKPQEESQKEVTALRKNQETCPELAPFYFQQHIWQTLVCRVFNAEACVWGGSVGQAFHRFCLEISMIDFSDMKELSRIKAHTADFLSKSSNDKNNAQVKKITWYIHGTLLIFMDPNQVDVAPIRLFNIVCRAVALNTQFLKSRAFFLINWLKDDVSLIEPYEYDVQYTRGDPDGESVVEVEVAPMLSKVGNADGDHFDKKTALLICSPVVTVNKVRDIVALFVGITMAEIIGLAQHLQKPNLGAYVTVVNEEIASPVAA